jgi:hypothetical protein
MAMDAGDRVSEDMWVEGAAGTRIEITIIDPLDTCKKAFRRVFYSMSSGYFQDSSKIILLK